MFITTHVYRNRGRGIEDETSNIIRVRPQRKRVLYARGLNF